MIRSFFITAVVAAQVLIAGPVLAGVYVFNTINPTDRVTHPTGYLGDGGELNVSVCIDPSSSNKSQLEIPVANAVRTWNARQAETGNIQDAGNNVPSNRYDAESVLVHELGHCVGLDHPHLDNNSGVPSSQRGYTHANRGANLHFNLDAGTDGVQGTADDERADDWNLHWYLKGINDPFQMPDVVDSSTVAVWPSDLPPGDEFVANANRNVAQEMGYGNTQSVMVQGTHAGESLRRLVADDVVTLLFAHSGVDRTAGTGDDYNLVLEYGGIQSGCDINVKMSGNSFAHCSVTADSIDGRNIHITSANLQLGSTVTYNWFFNDESNEGSFPPPDDPTPPEDPPEEPPEDPEDPEEPEDPPPELIFDDEFIPK